MKKNKENIESKGQKQVILEAIDVTKKWRTGSTAIDVLKKLNMVVRQGDVVALFGPSGAGKTTLLKCLIGIEGVDKGDVYFEGENIDLFDENEKSKMYSDIGLLLEDKPLIPALNVLENIEISTIRNSKLTTEEISNEISELLKFVSLEDRKKTQVDSLTFIEKQKVALCRELLKKPKVLICDEPTGKMTAIDAEHFMKLLLEVQKRFNVSLIIATNNLGLTVKCNKIMKLDNGRIL